MTSNRRFPRTLCLLAALAALLPALADAAERKSDGLSVRADGFDAELHTAASAGDLAMPEYPGAVAIAKDQDGSGALTLGFRFSDKAFRLNVQKYRSKDAPEKVLAFFEKELARYGSVLICVPAKSDPACDGYESKDGTTELRVGPKTDQRVVAVTPEKDGTRFAAVRLRKPADWD